MILSYDQGIVSVIVLFCSYTLGTTVYCVEGGQHRCALVSPTYFFILY